MTFDMRSAMELSRLSSRGVFGKALADIEQEIPELMVVAADVASSARVESIEKNAPGKFVNVGIAEQNMVGIAAGLASCGKTVFASSFASFASMRCFEMLRTQVGYMNLNVKMVALMSGMANGTVGNTHYGLEDIALTRTIPNMTVLCPCDPFETYKATQAAARYRGPVYLRLTGVNGFAPVYKTDFDFQIGHGIVVQEGKDIALIATGTMVGECVRAARGLTRQGVTPTVVDMHTIKPLDKELLDRLFDTYKLIVTVEEHFTIGGLGGAIAEYKANRENAPRQIMIGIPNEFQKVGSYAYMLDMCGLTAPKIAARIMECLKN